MIQDNKYIGYSLRKGRTSAFQNDLQQCYSLFLSSKPIPQLYTTHSFDKIWTLSKMKYIFQCIGQQEDQQQFAQHLYEIIIKKYFSCCEKISKIFAIFALYFAYCGCPNQCKICLSKNYITELNTFLTQNKDYNQSHYMKLCWHLAHKCILPCTKIGFRNPVIKPNGQPYRKPPVLRIDHTEFVKQLKKQINVVEKQLAEMNALRGKLKNYDCFVLSGDQFYMERVKEVVDCYLEEIQHYQED